MHYLRGEKAADKRRYRSPALPSAPADSKPMQREDKHSSGENAYRGEALRTGPRAQDHVGHWTLLLQKIFKSAGLRECLPGCWM
jgi:hypothetical protein